MQKQREKTAKKGKQFMWPDEQLELDFIELVKLYDPDLSINMAIVKLIRSAVKEWKLPGYISQPRGKKTYATNRLANDVIMVDRDS